MNRQQRRQLAMTKNRSAINHFTDVAIPTPCSDMVIVVGVPKQSSLLSRATYLHTNKYAKEPILNTAAMDKANARVEMIRVSKQIKKLKHKVMADATLKHRWNKLNHALARLEQAYPQ